MVGEEQTCVCVCVCVCGIPNVLFLAHLKLARPHESKVMRSHTQSESLDSETFSLSKVLLLIILCYSLLLEEKYLQCIYGRGEYNNTEDLYTNNLA